MKKDIREIDPKVAELKRRGVERSMQMLSNAIREGTLVRIPRKDGPVSRPLSLPQDRTSQPVPDQDA